MTEIVYKPEFYTENYIHERNIIKLCLNKYLENNITNLINSYLISYNYGFSLFEIKNNNFLKKDYSLFVIIRIIYELKIKSNNQIFDNIIDKIYKTKTNECIIINDLITFLNQYHQLSEINYVNNFLIFLGLLCKKLNLFDINSIVTKRKCLYCDREFTINYSFINIYNLEDLIDSLVSLGLYKQFHDCNNCKINIKKYKSVFEKSKLLDNKILIIDIVNVIKKQYFPKILDLPKHFSINKIANMYYLNFIILYKDNYHSIIIKKKNNWYHYLDNNILIVDDEYIFINSIYTTNLIYLKY